jgi:hypothetical protein
LPRYPDAFGEEIDAKAFGESHRVVDVAAWEHQEKLVEGNTLDDVIASQEERSSFDDVVHHFVADGLPESAFQLVKFNNAKADEAQWSLHALCAISFAKQL